MHSVCRVFSCWCSKYQELKLPNTKVQVNILDINTLNHAWASKQGVSLNTWSSQLHPCSCWADGHKSVSLSHTFFSSLLQYVLSDHIVCLPSPRTQIWPNNPEKLMNFSRACYTALWLTIIIIFFPQASPLRICLIQTFTHNARMGRLLMQLYDVCEEKELLAFLISACNGGKLFSSELSETVWAEGS